MINKKISHPGCQKLNSNPKNKYVPITNIENSNSSISFFLIVSMIDSTKGINKNPIHVGCHIPKKKPTQKYPIINKIVIYPVTPFKLNPIL